MRLVTGQALFKVNCLKDCLCELLRLAFDELHRGLLLGFPLRGLLILVHLKDFSFRVCRFLWLLLGRICLSRFVLAQDTGFVVRRYDGLVGFRLVLSKLGSLVAHRNVFDPIVRKFDFLCLDVIVLTRLLRWVIELWLLLLRCVK